MPDDPNQGVVPEEPIPTKPQTDPNAPKTDPNAPKEKTIDMGNGIIMEFVLIPAGEFDMGSPSTERDRDNDEGPVRSSCEPVYIRNYAGFRVVLEVE